MTNVPLLDLKAQFAQIRAEVMPIIEEVCASQRFILGEHVLALEAGHRAGRGRARGVDHGIAGETQAIGAHLHAGKANLTARIRHAAAVGWAGGLHVDAREWCAFRISGGNRESCSC